MDCKITGKRLSNFLSYEWIKIIAIILVAIFAFAYFYELTSVSLAPGQSVKYYIDENLTFNGTGNEVNFDTFVRKDVFSKDVKEVSCELLQKDNNVLSARLGVKEGSFIFTDNVKNDGATSRAETIVNVNCPYILDNLLIDAEDYLATYLQSSFDELNEEERREKALYFDNLDRNKIESNLNKRAKENRYYKNAIKHGEWNIEDECSRIKKLCLDVAEYKKLFAKDEEGNYINENIFYRYTRYYTQINDRDYGEIYTNLYNKEIENNRENAIYGIKLEELEGGKEDCGEYFTVTNTNSVNDVILQIFNFKESRADLQYEMVSLIVSFIREFSDILG